MRILTSGGIKIPIRASNFARLFYTQEFGVPLDEILMGVKHKTNEQTLMDDLMKIIWAMNKAENMACHQSTPTFDQWIRDYINFDANECAVDLFAEIRHGFTHKATGGAQSNTANADLPQIIISVALQMGMSESLLNELTTQSLLDIFKVYAGKKDAQQERRFATPGEISEYYG